MYSLQCKDGEEMIEGKCLIKCTDGQTRVGVVCTTPTGSTVVVCKDGEEMIEGKCLVKCTDGKTRVGVVCTTPTGSTVVVCKDGEEMIEGKCLIKCTDGKVRVGNVCTTNSLNTSGFTKTIELTKGSGFSEGWDASIGIAEIVVRVLESNGIRTLTKADYSSSVCDDGSNTGYCNTYPASNAIDGDNNNFAHTERTSPKLLFVLRDAKKVVDVTVFNRLSTADRLKGVKLSLYSEDNTLIKQCILTAEATSVCTP
jgi:hypothetical protein